MTRACDCFACGFVPFGLTGASSVSVSFVFPFISWLSIFGRQASDDFFRVTSCFCSVYEFLFLGRGLYLVHIHVSGSVTRWGLLIFYIFKGDSPIKSSVEFNLELPLVCRSDSTL